MKEPVFHAIDVNAWPMAQAFYYYTQMAPTTYTINVTMDVTVLRQTFKQKGLKFFPGYLYLTTKAIGKQQELRMAVREGALGYWETLTPVYPQFHEDDHTTSLLWTEYEDCFKEFYERYLEDTARHGLSHGILSSKGLPPANSYVISCIPWFTFNSFSLHNHGIKDYFVPSLESGGFVQECEKTLMPLSITAHHATTEGYHIKVFLEELQRAMNHPEDWL